MGNGQLEQMGMEDLERKLAHLKRQVPTKPKRVVADEE